MYPYVSRMYPYVTRMLVGCYSYVSLHPYVPYVTRMLLVCYPYVLVWCFSHDRYLGGFWQQRLITRNAIASVAVSNGSQI